MINITHMKKIFLLAIAVVVASCSLLINAQDPDIAAIISQKAVKSDSLSTMLGKLYGTRAAIDHSSTASRQAVLKSLVDALSVDSQDEEYKQGYSLANLFFQIAEGMKKDKGIDMNLGSYTKTLLSTFADTATVDVNAALRDINIEARRLMEEVGALQKDSLASNADMIALKSDSLSCNLGRFYGTQVREVCKQKKLSEAQIARLLEGFNYGVGVDENNKPVVDGKNFANEFIGTKENAKRKLEVNYNKDLFVAAFADVLNDPAVPTEEQYKALESQFKSYAFGVESFARENSAEALTHRTMGKKYIENIMSKDPGYVQTPSGLVYKVLAPGSGKQFGVDDKIKVMYKGTHVDGTAFDESKEPIEFSPGQVVPGFREALLMMRPGAKMIAVLPQELAYGARGAGDVIKPYETLVFEIEAIGLAEEAPAPEAAPAKSVAKPASKSVAKPAQSKATKPASTPAKPSGKTQKKK